MDKLEAIISSLVAQAGGQAPLTGIEIAEQFCPEHASGRDTMRNLNAAFLICLCGASHPHYSPAKEYLNNMNARPDDNGAAGFYLEGLSVVCGEFMERYSREPGFREEVERLCARVRDPEGRAHRNRTAEDFWRVFFPEGVAIQGARDHAIESLRRKRRIRIHRLNSRPILYPEKEILFTSNVLLTLPPRSASIAELDVPDHMEAFLEKVREEPQLYWYDHPVQMGAASGNNEVLYGLQGLDRAVEFEKDRGTIGKGARVNCVLSVSVTHAGLKELARPYLEHMLRQAGRLRHLSIHVFTESDTSSLVNEVMAPASARYHGDHGPDFHDIIGVDGEYGRHYSFLKAVSPLWQVFVDSRIRATFKIDLDQVFPQEALVKESGHSAFEHFRTPLWGAMGEDSGGNPVELGMIAGALVNRKDIGVSLYTPDVGFPEAELGPDEWIFRSPLPQALSTEAEMMTRYGQEDLDGKEFCIQRFHVTGGTCGILNESLRRHSPFTPGFIGRAEDQAYILSTLFKDSGPHLRYVHKDGLIMRHDKEAFAGEAIRAADTGKVVGDYTRILLFSHYVKALPWPVGRTKEWVDPFTGCFVSHLPFTVVFLRLALKGASMFHEGKPEEGFEMLEMGARRLGDLIQRLARDPDELKQVFEREKRAWKEFFDVLDRLEQDMGEGDPFALELGRRVEEIMERCRVET
jgi:hypothetical protein